MTESADIVSTRLFAAPRAAVYGAFTDVHRLARWWGPKGFTNTFVAFDPRTGGAWQLLMHGPDGKDYPVAKEFVEVVPGERVVLQQLGETHRFRMTMTFADEAGGTRLTWVMRFEVPEEGEALRAFLADANEANFDRLAALLAPP